MLTKSTLGHNTISQDMPSSLKASFSVTVRRWFLPRKRVGLFFSVETGHSRFLSGNTLSKGLKASIEAIDNRGDFKTFMQNYAYARGSSTSRGPRRDGPSDEGFLPPIPAYNRDRHTPDTSSNGHHTSDKGRPTFGVDLAEQMTRDDAEVPPIMRKCCEAIEKYGMDITGIYRLSGTTSKVQNLKHQLDKGTWVCSKRRHLTGTMCRPGFCGSRRAGMVCRH